MPITTITLSAEQYKEIRLAREAAEQASTPETWEECANKYITIIERLPSIAELSFEEFQNRAVAAVKEAKGALVRSITAGKALDDALKKVEAAEQTNLDQAKVSLLTADIKADIKTVRTAHHVADPNSCGTLWAGAIKAHEESMQKKTKALKDIHKYLEERLEGSTAAERVASEEAAQKAAEEAAKIQEAAQKAAEEAAQEAAERVASEEAAQEAAKIQDAALKAALTWGIERISNRYGSVESKQLPSVTLNIPDPAGNTALSAMITVKMDISDDERLEWVKKLLIIGADPFDLRVQEAIKNAPVEIADVVKAAQVKEVKRWLIGEIKRFAEPANCSQELKADIGNIILAIERLETPEALRALLEGEQTKLSEGNQKLTADESKGLLALILKAIEFLKELFSSEFILDETHADGESDAKSMQSSGSTYEQLQQVLQSGIASVTTFLPTPPPPQRISLRTISPQATISNSTTEGKVTPELCMTDAGNEIQVS